MEAVKLHEIHASKASEDFIEQDAQAEKPLPQLPGKRSTTWSWMKPSPRKRTVTIGSTLKRMLGLDEKLDKPRIAFSDAFEVSREDVLQLLNVGILHSLQIPLERVLIVDVRNAEAFAGGHIVGSVNCNVPSMFLKRARKNPKATKFHLESFLCTSECKETFYKWVEVTKDKSRVILVLDDDMAMEKKTDLQGDGWATLMLVSRALQGDGDDQGLITSDGVILAYLKGGWNGFAATNYVASSVPKRALTVSPNVSVHLTTSSTPIGTPLSGVTLQGTPVEATSLPLLSTTSKSNGSMFKIDTKKKKLSKQVSGSMPNMQSRLSIPSEGNFSTMPSLVVHTFPKSKVSSDNVDSAVTAVGYQSSPLIVNTVQMPEFSVTPASPLKERMESLSTIQSIPSMNRSTSMSSVSIRIDEGLLAKSPSSESVLYSPSGSSTPGSAVSAPAACTQVLPNVFIGSEEMVASVFGLEQLRSLGVTHILNVATEVHTEGFSVCTAGDVKGDDRPTFKGYKRMEIRDHANEAMDGYLREGVEWLGKCHASFF